MPSGSSYCVLRVCPRAPAEAWWSALRERHDVPGAIRVLLSGRIRVELTREEAAAALAWAAGIRGWVESDPRPLFVYDPGAEHEACSPDHPGR